MSQETLLGPRELCAKLHSAGRIWRGQRGFSWQLVSLDHVNDKNKKKWPTCVHIACTIFQQPPSGERQSGRQLCTGWHIPPRSCRGTGYYYAHSVSTRNPLTLWSVPVLVRACTGVGAHMGWLVTPSVQLRPATTTTTTTTVFAAGLTTHIIIQLDTDVSAFLCSHG